MRTADYYSAVKKKETLPSATTRRGLDGTVPSGVRQAEEGKCRMISLTRGI